MAEPATTVGTGHPLDWLLELTRRVPAYTFMAGMFVYYLLYVNPQKDLWWWTQLEGVRTSCIQARVAYEDRKETQLRLVETQCYQSIASASLIGQQSHALLEQQRSTLDELRSLLKEHCHDQR